MNFWTTALLTLAAAGALAAGPASVRCEPDTLRGIPGEPLRAELTIQTPHARKARILVPAASNLVLRTVEIIPIQRNKDGQFIQKRILTWQGIEAGSCTLTNLTVVFQGLDKKAGQKNESFQGLETICPPIRITIDAVPEAPPPPATVEETE